MKTLNSFVRVVDIAGQFQLTTEQVQLSLARLSRIRVEGLPLITVRQKEHYLTFDMPRHREFVKQIGFAKFNSSKGWKALRGCIQNVASQKKYKFDKLDQWQLLDKLISLSVLLLVTKLGTVIPPTIIIARSNSTHSTLLFDNKKILSPFLICFSLKKLMILFILFDVS